MLDEQIGAARAVATAWLDALGVRPQPPPLAQTPRDEHALEGGARLYRFHRPGVAPTVQRPILLVPSLINRWYVLDLRPGASLVEALVGAGLDVWLLDWGVPEAEDRFLDWDAVLRRLGRAVRKVQRTTAQPKLGVLGYCMGGSLTAIHAAQHPDAYAALVTLAAPIDFSAGGMLKTMVDPRWFDADAIADAGNVAPSQMQSGFTALRPTLDAAKLMSYPDLCVDAKARAGFLALEAWAGDNIPFPAAAYRRYIRELYQENQLVTGTHRANGRPAPLSAITCPTLVITASRDTICPPAAATALTKLVSSRDTAVIEVAGGHVGACVGSKAAKEMYPALIRWLAPRLA
ncbi:MAG TPA: alpha/beta fold hydrolase [Kofleriaceae bacterium]|nr:alpha/beta fold hydrolase [Kofleriaceae bacterium]